MEKKEKNSKFAWDVFDVVEVFIICTAVIVLIFSLFVRMTVVDGNSMNDTLQNGEYLLIRDFIYTPERGDIVVVNDVSKKSYGEIYSAPLVKRVIAVGGDTVEIKSGVVYVNGIAQKEDYIKELMRPDNMSEITVGENQIFVMGDNRNNSGDSRTFGPVDARCVIGKAFLRVFPFNTFSYLHGANS